MSREAMQIALDALEANLGNWAAKTKAVEVLRQALETDLARVGEVGVWGECEWVGLTDQEIHEIDGYEEDRKMYRFARTIEAKLKEKNT
jgi:hypothetical protein